jgi:hypothetical protein
LPRRFTSGYRDLTHSGLSPAIRNINITFFTPPPIGKGMLIEK